MKTFLDALLVVEGAAKDGGLEVLVGAGGGVWLGGARVHECLAARVRNDRVVVYSHHELVYVHVHLEIQ